MLCRYTSHHTILSGFEESVKRMAVEGKILDITEDSGIIQ